MADSPALRMQRMRRHQRGDHSICQPGRCNALGVNGRNYIPPPRPLPEPGRVTEAVQRHVSQFTFAEGDPRGVSSVIAIRLAEALDETGKPGIARELDLVLSQIGLLPDEEATIVNELHLRAHVRHAAQLLNEAQQQHQT